MHGTRDLVERQHTVFVGARAGKDLESEDGEGVDVHFRVVREVSKDLGGHVPR